MAETVKVKAVTKAISAVTAEMSKLGITKERKNKEQGFMFRGIDDVYNALAPILPKNNLIILPHITARSVTERTTKAGGVLFTTILHVDYSFISTEDDSEYIIPMIGEAMDSGDKGTNKALSAAYKLACIQVFCIPVEGEPDADDNTHEVDSLAVDYEQKLVDLSKSLKSVKDMGALQAMINVTFKEPIVWLSETDPDRYEQLNEFVAKISTKLKTRKGIGTDV